MTERGCAQVGRCRIKILLEGQLVAKKFILSISDDYPESYWLKIKMLSGEDSGVFKEGVAVSKDLKICFEGSKRVRASKLLGCDFLYSDGPNLISPRLYELTRAENISGVQYVDADLLIGEVSYAGYKVFNVIDKSPAFNLKESIGEPLLSYMPDGPK
ncbi:hypothetical protein PPUJ20005_53580 [Pseudomonas putida]|uniref:hypothetical protein n=1 Tax=Pseudomonas putida TaxID=303 RepID=UPI00235DAAC6|nr:hypothetical protein [Pseudomonas putida]GLO11386.1 hypothetical protein PPUJ20005_53580 [Pseudomonas putida]